MLYEETAPVEFRLKGVKVSRRQGLPDKVNVARNMACSASGCAASVIVTTDAYGTKLQRLPNKNWLLQKVLLRRTRNLFALFEYPTAVDKIPNDI